MVGRGEVGGGGAGEAHRGQISAANDVTVVKMAMLKRSSGVNNYKINSPFLKRQLYLQY